MDHLKAHGLQKKLNQNIVSAIESLRIGKTGSSWVDPA